MELIVCRDTPIASASWPWASSRWFRSVRTLFFITASCRPKADDSTGHAAAGRAPAVRAWQGRDDNGREPAYRDDRRPAALPDGQGNRATRHEQGGGPSDHA